MYKKLKTRVEVEDSGRIWLLPPKEMKKDGKEKFLYDPSIAWNEGKIGQSVVCLGKGQIIKKL